MNKQELLHKRKLRREQQRRYRAKYPDKEKIRKNKESHNINNYLWMIYLKIIRFAEAHTLKIAEWQEFKQWSLSGLYVDLFNAWRHSNWNPQDSPIIQRGILKRGFWLDNLHWDIRRNDSKYDGSKELVEEMTNYTNDLQLKLNPGTEESRARLKKQIADMRARGRKGK